MLLRNQMGPIPARFGIDRVSRQRQHQVSCKREVQQALHMGIRDRRRRICLCVAAKE